MKLSNYRNEKKVQFHRKSMEWYLNQNLNQWIESYQHNLKQFWIDMERLRISSQPIFKEIWNGMLNHHEESIYRNVKNAAHCALELMTRLEK